MENLEVVVLAGSSAITGIIGYYLWKEAKYLGHVKVLKIRAGII